MIEIVRNTFFNLNAILINSLFVFAFSIVAARILGPEQYGAYGLILWFFGFAATFVNLGIPNTIAKFVSEYQGRDQAKAIGQIVGFALKVKLFLICLTCTVFLLSSGGIAHFLGNRELTLGIFIAVIAIIPHGLGSIFYSALRGLRHYRIFFYVNLWVAPLTFLLSLAAILMGYGVPGILAGYALSQLITLICYARFFKRTATVDWRGPIDPKLRRRLLGYNATLVGIILLDMITIQRIETFFLGKFRSLEEVGYYALAFGLAFGLFSFIVKAMTGVLVPTASELYGAGKEGELRRVYTNSARLFALVMIPICALGFTTAPWLIAWMYGADYRGAILPFQILLISACISSLTGASSSIAFGIGRQLFILKLGVVMAFLTLLLDFALIPFFGAVGAACADLTVKWTMAASYLIYFFYSCKMAWPAKAISKIALASVIAATSGALISTGPLFIFSFGILYLASLFFVKAVQLEDIQFLQILVGKVPFRFRRLLLKTLASVEGHVR